MTVKIALTAFLIGCMPPPPAQPVYVTATATASAGVNSSESDGAPPVASWSTVQVLVDKRVNRPTEVVGVLDFHSDANSEDKGFDELRAHAAALGADAVIGAEFEHGEGNEPSHLSGMAVRFLDR